LQYFSLSVLQPVEAIRVPTPGKQPVTGKQKAVMDKLAAEATEEPHPETMPSSGETSAPAADAGGQVGVARAEQLLGTWLDATNEDRTAKISKEGDTFLYEDNEGKYQVPSRTVY
jgi:hypothetical protein